MLTINATKADMCFVLPGQLLVRMFLLHVKSLAIKRTHYMIFLGYFVELAMGFGALSLLSILVGVSTGSRRRRIWRAVAGLVLLHGAQ